MHALPPPPLTGWIPQAAGHRPLQLRQAVHGAGEAQCGASHAHPGLLGGEGGGHTRRPRGAARDEHGAVVPPGGKADGRNRAYGIAPRAAAANVDLICTACMRVVGWVVGWVGGCVGPSIAGGWWAYIDRSVRFSSLLPFFYNCDPLIVTGTKPVRQTAGSSGTNQKVRISLISIFSHRRCSFKARRKCSHMLESSSSSLRRHLE